MDHKVDFSKDYVARINLKPDCVDRKRLMQFCLEGEQQQIVIGWSYVYEPEYKYDINTYDDYYAAVKDSIKKSNKKLNSALNLFKDAEVGDLFFTRDLNGEYWICRALEKAKCHCDYDLDIGALIPVQAYKIGLEVPGQIKSSFNRPRGGIVERLYDSVIIEYAKHTYNKLSKEDKYSVSSVENDLLSNLPPFGLEELVIAYIQLHENFYVLSNSIAQKSTTIKIECELISRDVNNPQKAVVQVKGEKGEIDADDYISYINNGYVVYLYAPVINNIINHKNLHIIKKEDLLDFYNSYKPILPTSITTWENLFK